MACDSLKHCIGCCYDYDEIFADVSPVALSGEIIFTLIYAKKCQAFVWQLAWTFFYMYGKQKGISSVYTISAH